MAIEKNNSKVSRFDREFSPNSRESMSSDDDELQRRIYTVESEDDDDEFDDADSGAGSDDFDLLELGEMGAEFCQIGNMTCSVPLELYDLPGLEDILSVNVWNDVLTEEEKFSLSKYLPDLELDMIIRTLKELFEGENFHFGSPIKKLFEMLNGGLCEPRVALYREGWNFFQKRKHYHLLRKHQNSMVSNLCQIRDAWLNCRGYSIQEKLRVLNIMKSQNSLMNEKFEEDFESDPLDKEELDDGLWGQRLRDRIDALKLAHNSAYGVGSDLEIPSRMPSMGVEVVKHGKQNPKGMLKSAGSKTASSKEMIGQFPSVYPGLDTNAGPYGSSMNVGRQNKKIGHGPGVTLRLRDQLGFDDENEDAEDTTYRMPVRRGRNVTRGTVMDKSGVLRTGKKNDLLRSDELAADDYMGLPFSSKNDLLGHGRNRNANHLPDVLMTKPSCVRNSYEIAKKAKYPDNLQWFPVRGQMKSLKNRVPQVPMKNNQVDSLNHAEQVWHGKNQGQLFMDSLQFDDWKMRGKKWKTGRESLPQLNNRIQVSDLRAKPSQENLRTNIMQNGELGKGALRGNRMYMRSEETESDSSDQFEEEEEEEEDDDDDDDELDNPMMRSRSGYHSGVIEGSRSSMLKSGLDAKKVGFSNRGLLENETSFDDIPHFFKKVGGFSEVGHVPGYSSKSKHKGKMHNGSPLRSSGTRLEDGSHFDMVKLKGNKKIQKLGKNGQLKGENGERLHLSLLKAHPSDQKMKGEVNRNYSADEEDDSLETRLLEDENALGRLGKRRQATEAYRDKSEASLLGRNSVTRKRKAKEEAMDIDRRDEDGNMQGSLQQKIDDSGLLKKKGKRKLDVATASADVETSKLPVREVGTVDGELEIKPQKKPYTPITPTVHTGFSFSIIHLLSAARMAMITPLVEDGLEVGKAREEQTMEHESSVNGVVSHEDAGVNKLGHAAQLNVPSLTVQEIVNRVRSNPGDPCILETQEPLQDLVRGVLRTFSSKSGPLGAKGWKALVVYEKSTKGWSWIGPVSHTSVDHETMEEVTSPEYWGLPHKMLVKLVDAFANWLKSGQETLQQIGSLPAPPLSLMQCNLDEKERFKDLRAQKSLNTISPSSEEVRAYFRREEVLRYSIPDRAFSYTAADGKKTIVAPLRRGGGKPTAKARDHFMLKRDRPPHVTILCLVRDAAARLPGRIGTRADVCTLIRDSQYIVEDVSDAQVNQVVSGALDRLHYERDPCVQFDGERKLWVYLHREREEEDFEDDGTSSTKKWKRQKKDSTDQSDRGAVTVAFHGTEDEPAFELGSDLNAEPSGIDDNKRTDLGYSDVGVNEENSVDGGMHQGQPMAWDDVGLNPTRDNKLLCQENSTNEDFDDETFGREGPTTGLLSASLL